ncbi:MAG TPA: S24 family peptidase [Segeticoccus sp.]|uniref:S24 family peptidase n=1 Tax=Segeticoccus sp. TaxID=2706531 RepID=UPI002D80B888|nr:S24 family peptidase [Segeticoccus sp.]HET8601771.1 S24 family peptidase [Segeticoccus sp.]
MRSRQLGLALVRGRSMEPTLHEGDRLLVLYAGKPRPGALALVRLPDAPTGPRPLAVKRLRRRETDGWWVEGDNLGAGVDSWTVGTIPDGDVVARVLLRLPGRGPLARLWRRR